MPFRLLIVFLLFQITGCQVIQQNPETVLFRKSGDLHYNYKGDPKDFLKYSRKYWDYAVMSENSYHRSNAFPVGNDQLSKIENCNNISESEKIKILKRIDPRDGLEEFEGDNKIPLLEDWRDISNFPSQNLWCASVKEGLAFRVYEKTTNGITKIRVSFRGTVASYGPNWRANTRWFHQWITQTPDAYTVVRDQFTDELASVLLKTFPEQIEQGKLEISATGHSLGGSLAQQFAYAFPPEGMAKRYPALKLKKVVAFDPSPANGWHWVNQELREKNAGGLAIHRVFQHGEGLAYARLLLGYVYPLSDGECTIQMDGKKECLEPAISEARFNLQCVPPVETGFGTKLANFLAIPVSNHSMRLLACGLAKAANHPPSNFEGTVKMDAVD